MISTPTAVPQESVRGVCLSPRNGSKIRPVAVKVVLVGVYHHALRYPEAPSG